MVFLTWPGRAHISVLLPKVMHSKIMKSYCVGIFKIDVGTVYSQPGKCLVCRTFSLARDTSEVVCESGLRFGILVILLVKQ